MFEFGDVDSWAEDFLMRQELQKALAAKEVVDFLQKLADVRPEPEAAPEVPVDPATAYFHEKLGRLRQRIDALKGELDARRELRHQFRGEIDYQISQAAFSLEQFRFWGIGYNRGVDIKRNFLERQLADFRHKRRQEELRFWDDVAEARSKLREAIAEYRDTLRALRLTERAG
jgi:hypothetical protein